MSNTLRKLRIALSVCCGTVCLLLIVLWVRSLSDTEKLFLQYDATRGIRVIVGAGRIQIEPSAERWWIATGSWGSTTIAWIEPTYNRLSAEPATLDFMLLNIDAANSAPLWCPVLLLAVFTAIPWLRWRFGLRTLLIAITLASVFLGAIVYAVR
jgi:hypothetical protein